MARALRKAATQLKNEIEDEDNVRGRVLSIYVLSEAT
jgi:hypothetical protein